MGLLIGDVVRSAALAAPTTAAATLGDEVLTFAELDARADRVAHALRGLGVRHGDRVVWWGETHLDALPIFAAVPQLGAVFPPLTARSGAPEARPAVVLPAPGVGGIWWPPGGLGVGLGVTWPGPSRGSTNRASASCGPSGYTNGSASAVVCPSDGEGSASRQITPSERVPPWLPFADCAGVGMAVFAHRYLKYRDAPRI